MKNLIVGAAFALVFAAQTSQAATWGVKELLVSTTEVTNYFKAEYGETLYNKISGISVKLNVQKIAALAEVTYKDENNKVVVAKFFCHEHEEGVIDCH